MNRKQKNPLGTTGQTVAYNIRRIRKAQGLSLRELSARLRSPEVQRPITPEGLQRVESGVEPDSGRVVRRVDADDLMALAVVLGVNPNALLLPPNVNGNAYITGRGEVHAATAWEWANGQRPINPDPDDTERYEFLARTRPRRTPAGY